MPGISFGFDSYSVQEAQNSSMCQVCSVYLDTDGQTLTPTNGVIVAITMITDCAFDTLTPEDSTKYIGISSSGYESAGNTYTASDSFPSGMTIYGRWTSVSVNSSGEKCICYIG